MDKILFNSLSFPFIALIFVFLTIFLLFYRMNNKENNKTIVYYYMILITIIIILFEILLSYTTKHRDSLYILNEIICRSYVFFSVAWSDILLYYMLLYSEKNNEKKVFLFSVSNLALALILCIFIPPEFNSTSFYTFTGPLAAYLHIWCAIMCIVEVVPVITKKVYVKNLNPLPLYIGTIGYFGLVVYQVLNDTYFNILAFMFTLIVVVLFYSAESQDDKLIEEFENQKLEAEKVNEEKEKFLYNMSKEIRTPMSNIIGLCNIISLNKDELVIDDIKFEGNKIYSESTKLLATINNILDLARYEAQKEELSEKNYLFEEMILDLNESIINKYNIYPEYKFKEGLPYNLYGDNNKIKKVVDLIIEKEIRKTSIGKISIEYSYDSKNNGAYNGVILITLVYDGIINNEKENDIELEESIIEKCSELLKCTIEEKNVSEIRKEFIIKYNQIVINERLLENISSKIKENNSNLMNESNKVLDCSNKKILIVDDSQININILKRLFKKYNFNIDEALSGKDCLEMFKTNRYDIIFIDDLMPELSGIQTFEELKKMNKKLPPIIIVTANSYDGLKEEYLGLGFTDYVSKPIDAKIIDNMIYKYINKGGD